MPHIGFGWFSGTALSRCQAPGLCALHKKSLFDIPKCHVKLTVINVTNQ